MTEGRAKRKLSAVLSADVKGYSRLMGQDETGTVDRLKEYRALMTDLIQQYRGRVVDSPGDNILSEFFSVVDATECAVKIQEELKNRNVELPKDRRMEFRIGINLGDVIEDEDSIYGDGVNIAARIESLAEGGGICISGSVFDQIEGKIPLNYDDLGEQSVKNIKKPVQVYRIYVESEESLMVEEEVKLPDEPSIAVLPFENMSGDPEQEYFSDGLTEEIITGLSKIPKMFVIARNSTFRYKGTAPDIRQIGQELDARYVLEGSVRKAGNRVRISAQLVDTKTDYHLWAERYDRNLDDIFAIQDEISATVVDQLKITLLGDIPTTVEINPEAYALYLHARHLARQHTPEAWEQSNALADQALLIDPGFAGPWTVKSSNYSNMINASLIPKDEGWALSRQAAENAVTIDPDNGEAYAKLGVLPGRHVLAGRARGFGQDKAGFPYTLEFIALPDTTYALELIQGRFSEKLTIAVLRAKKGDQVAKVEIWP